jgi:hypothetical protein
MRSHISRTCHPIPSIRPTYQLFIVCSNYRPTHSTSTTTRAHTHKAQCHTQNKLEMKIAGVFVSILLLHLLHHYSCILVLLVISISYCHCASVVSMDNDMNSNNSRTTNKAGVYVHNNANNNNRLIVLAETPNLLRNMRSTIDYVFDIHHKNLGITMSNLDYIVQSMEASTQQSAQYSNEDDTLANAAVLDVHEEFMQLCGRVPALWEHNELLMREIISVYGMTATYTLANDNVDVDIKGDSNTSTVYDAEQADFVASYESIHQSLGHINRDWSPGGATIRQSLYREGIIDALMKFASPEILLPTAARARILVPGAGAGRLAFELAARGFRLVTLFG